nr:L-serine ammonia-lyase [Dactylosporangium thailandense]
MTLSAFDLYSIGIGPSSSHTVGPMRAARRFAVRLAEAGLLPRTGRVKAELFGSLGATGHGHGSARAVVLGLRGEDPATVDTGTEVASDGRIALLGEHDIPFSADADLVLHRRRSLPEHPNGMRFTAWTEAGEELLTRTYFSVGGGFVVGPDGAVAEADVPVKFPFTTGAELLAHCEGRSISDVMLANELSWRSEAEVRAGLLHIWAVMQECVRSGCTRPDGVLPGGLKVRRRAPRLYRDLCEKSDISDPLHVMDWLNLYALAVNEENASGGRVVTAPTNGAAGIIPAVLHYAVFPKSGRFVPGADDDGVVRFLLAAAAVGIIIKGNASISGAEVGCQGEVGSACAMAAAGLCEALGGAPGQVENAAEIGLEHNLGLTCDPVGGLVQIPCIERNAIASVKAVNAARLALNGDGAHHVTLDKVVRTMRETGRDMSVKYKETARGGLAVTVIEC